jgi:hypothetical protein
MAGRPKKRARENPGPNFNLIYPFKTEFGWMTLRQEIFCWRYALHGVGMKAYREAFESTTKGATNTGACRQLSMEKVQERVKELQELHKRGAINLEQGPWDYYDCHGTGQPNRRIERVNNAKLAAASLLEEPSMEAED